MISTSTGQRSGGIGFRSVQLGQLRDTATAVISHVRVAVHRFDRCGKMGKLSSTGPPPPFVANLPVRGGKERRARTYIRYTLKGHQGSMRWWWNIHGPREHTAYLLNRTSCAMDETDGYPWSKRIYSFTPYASNTLNTFGFIWMLLPEEYLIYGSSMQVIFRETIWDSKRWSVRRIHFNGSLFKRCS